VNKIHLISKAKLARRDFGRAERAQNQALNQTAQSLWKPILRYLVLLLAAGLVIVACNRQSQPQSVVSNAPTEDAALTIWWEKGFALEEDEALQQVVDRWQAQTGQAVKLSFYTTDDLAQRAQRALQANDPPDLMMSHSAEQSLNPRLAWQGKLLDLSEVIEPIQDSYPKAVLDGVRYYNNAEKKRSYYAVPFSQTAMYIFYWRDLVQAAGFDQRKFPLNWNQYWDEWQQIQKSLRQKGEKTYSLGFTLTIGAADANHWIEQVLEAFDARLLDTDGKLLIDDSTVQQQILASLKWVTQFYQQGYVPPDAIKWLSPDNNNSLLNRTVAMTPNATLSIPTAVQQDQETYLNKLGTLELPNKPSGEPMRYVVLHRQIISFAASRHAETAKQFLTYLIEPATLNAYLKVSGRNLPVTKPVWQDTFWTNPADPHLSVASKVLLEDQTRPFYSAYHPAYSLVIEEAVWTKAINRILLENISVEQATAEAIAKIKQIFEQWR
jgi:multiple sugar transport system substrate-binding protein